MSRDVVQADCLEWLRQGEARGAVVAALPDAAELGMEDPDAYTTWFCDAVDACMDGTAHGAPTVYYQTDRRWEGRLVDKAGLVSERARARGWDVLWHKVALVRDPGSTDLYRPTYSHLVAVGPDGVTSGRATPDVFYAGRKLYENATGMRAAEVAVRFVTKYTDTVVDAFCGRGTVLAIADALGYDAVGVDIDPEQCERARELQLQAVTA